MTKAVNVRKNTTEISECERLQYTIYGHERMKHVVECVGSYISN